MNRTLSLLLLAASACAQTTPQRPVFQPSLAPDRAELAFVSGGDIWTAPLAGGEARLLVSHPATESRPLYSPDGRHLAFVSTRTGNGDIYVLGLDTGELRRVTYGDSNDQLDAWSRDGQWLYFTSTQGEVGNRQNIFRVKAAGGTPMPVVSERYVAEYWAAPAPQGETLALTAKGIVSSQWWRNGHSHIDESEIWLRSGDGSYQQVTKGGAKSAWAMWSADGKRLLYMSDRSGAENLWEQPLNGQPRPLTTFTSGRVLWPSISYDGKTVVFERGLGLWRLDVASGKAAPIALTLRGAPAGEGTTRLSLTSRFSDLALSPDGKKVAFIARGEVYAASSKDGGTAERLTRTEAPESDPLWAPDSRRVVYTSSRDGSYQLYLYDFSIRTETQLTSGPAGSHSPRWSPDGKSLACFRGRSRLVVLDVAAKTEKEVAQGEFSLPPITADRPFAWSPDNQWLAFFNVGPRRFSNVYVVPAAGGKAQPVSFLANVFGGSISWSPDGKFLLFNTTQRTEDTSLARVDLLKRTPKFREDQFRELFRDETRPNTVQPVSTPPNPPPPGTAPAATPAAAAPAAPVVPTEPKKDDKKVTVVWEDIRRRLSFLPLGVSANEYAVTPDGKTLVLTASVAGQFNIYTFPLDELTKDPLVAKQITSTAGFKTGLQIAPDGKEAYYLEQGRLQAVNLDTRALRPVAITAELDVRFDQEKQQVFREAWTYLNDWFYDPHFHGANWTALRQRFEPYVLGSATGDELRRVLSLMIGELNASHTGISGQPNGAAEAGTGRLGLQFDRAEYEQNGRYKIASILPLGPVDVTGGVQPGQYLLAVEGTKLTPDSNLDELLQFRTNRRTALTIAGAAAGTGSREVAVLPVSSATEAGLTYRQWVEERRAFVSQASTGRLGYVHIRDMSAESLNQLAIDLDAENQGRDGVVIDIRDNNGGFVNAYALDIFTRKHYLNMTYRGSEITAPARTVLGQRSLEKPTILVTNHASLSDAEDFTEGYRALKAGKVVGEPTAGWIIYTSGTQLVDGSVLRLPFIKVTTAAGVNMERNPRPVDIAVNRALGEEPAGQDSQLDRAVRELLNELGPVKVTQASH